MDSLFIKGIDDMTEFLTNAVKGMQLLFKCKQLNENFDTETNIFKRFKLGISILYIGLKYKAFIRKDIHTLQEALNFLLMVNTKDINKYKVFIRAKRMPSYFVGVHYCDNRIIVNISYAFKSLEEQFTNMTIVFDRNDSITKNDKCVKLERFYDKKEILYISFEELEETKDAKNFLAIIKQILFELAE
mgnify:CR=1 FL=1